MHIKSETKLMFQFVIQFYNTGKHFDVLRAEVNSDLCDNAGNRLVKYILIESWMRREGSA